ncbi:hypothetical protein FIBSPDRAFT_1048105 [Athelia psychrophila]|uniref:Uncharacterized protein n=1 Tax=Athelia psychrophila TaxID=1759441 RepID=A0A166E737_9AGAM|nr:hypothetical protein FIBSPDRAFT_1048105 [Fibularhizoctonia sp. CBS 109695]
MSRKKLALSLAKRPYDEDQPTTTRPPTIRLAERPDESWDDDPSDSDSDHDLEDLPLDHTASSHDTFSIGSHIDITIPPRHSIQCSRPEASWLLPCLVKKADSAVHSPLRLRLLMTTNGIDVDECVPV